VRRYFECLRPSDRSAIDSVPDGLFLVRVDRVAYRWQAQKPYYQIRFVVLEPNHLAGCLITGRLYSTPRAMWKLSWFLRDFGYDTELLAKDEIDDQALVGLQGCAEGEPCHRAWHLRAQPRRIRPAQPLAGTLSHSRYRAVILPDLR
jgi:hypothetical protein